MRYTKTKVLVSVVALVIIYHGGKWGYGEAAEAYFNHKCETEAGEFIYRTVENVEGLFQMRPRDPRDYFTRIREGDIPEDPYGHTNMEGQEPEGLFIYPSKNRNYYKYLETTRPPNAGEFHDVRFPETKLAEELIITGDKYWLYNYYGPASDWGSLYVAKQTSALQSKYGYTWKELRDKQDIRYGVWGGEIIVKELSTDEVLAVKRGFFYRDKFTKKMTICPQGKDSHITDDFIRKVLKPIEGKEGEEYVN